MIDIVLVGNGPSAVTWPAGEMIDNTLDVVRFNNFVTDVYERFVGTKTTIWVRNDTQGVSHRDVSTVLTVSRPDRPKPDTLIPPRYAGGWASTGVTAALHFLGQGRRVGLHGFDFFAAARHHYFPSLSCNRDHRPAAERTLLAPFFRSGQLIILRSMRRE